jgi:hypothetical protein
MTVPSVRQTERDNSLGILPPGSKMLAVAGVSSLGAFDLPAPFTRVSDLVAARGIGPGVEAAAHYINQYGNPVLFVRTHETTVGAIGAIAGNTGTSVITLDGGAAPLDDYDFAMLIVNGGTIGIAGITFQWSVDGGRTYSPIQALGVATSFVFGDTGIQLDFAAGTLVSGDTITTRASAPQWITSELTSALTALRNSAQTWELVEVVGPCVGADLDALDAALVSMSNVGKLHAAIAHVRTPNLGEDDPTYQAAMAAISALHTSRFIEVCAGAMETVSPITGRQYRRPPSFTIAAREASLSQEISGAEVDLGPLPVTVIHDGLGNPKYHDEFIQPGLDDARFCVLRSFEGRAGAFENISRMFSPVGSDFIILPYRRVMNLARSISRTEMELILNKPIRVNKLTGFIDERDATRIEKRVTQQLRLALGQQPMVSAVQYVLNRTDNLLATGELHTQLSIVPLGYSTTITEDDLFVNPALAAIS